MMKEEKTLFQRFRLWLAGLIGGSVFTYELRLTNDANEVWRRSNAGLKWRIKRLQQELSRAAREIHCAGSIDHRIKMLKNLHAQQIRELEFVIDGAHKVLDTYKVPRLFAHPFDSGGVTEASVAGRIDALWRRTAELPGLWIDFLKSADCYGEYGVEIPEELSARLDIGLDLARRIVFGLGGVHEKELKSIAASSDTDSSES